MRRLLWILLAVLTIALLVLVLQQNEAALAELSRFETSSLETKIMAKDATMMAGPVLVRGAADAAPAPQAVRPVS